MLAAHLPLLLVAVIATALGGAILILSKVLGPKRPSRVKGDAFECGNPPSGTARQPFNVRFYLVAILFLVFDIEAVFIYPWAVTFSDSTKGKSVVSPTVAILEMVTFVAVIVVGLVYAWRKGALEWAPKQIALVDRVHAEEEAHHG